MKFALICLVAAGAFAQDQSSSIIGTITDSLTRQPVRKALVSVNIIGNPAGVKGGASAVSTDAGGGFRLDHLPAGDYQITVRHQDYPQTRLGGVRKIATIKPGEQSTTLDIQLTPGAAVSGRVLDEDGDPMEGCMVRAMYAAHTASDINMTEAGLNAVAEGGSYRIFRLIPGKYIMRAECNGAVFVPRALSTGPDPSPSAAYPLQYYPGTDSVASAEVFDLLAGADRAGVDFKMKPAAVTSIHASLTGADWQGRAGLSWRLVGVDDTGRASHTAGGAINATGVFEIPAVLPGSYLLIVTQANGPTENPVGGIQRIEVRDKPIQTQVGLRHGIDISGTVEVEGGNPSGKVNLSQARIYLSPVYSAVSFGNAETRVSDDGAFTIKSVIAVPMRLHINTGGAFIKSARLGGMELVDAVLDTGPGGEGPLRIVLSTNTATVQGTGPPNATIWAVPLAMAHFENTGGTHSGPTGQFTMPGLAPGQYLIGASENPLFMTVFDRENCREVTVREGDSVTVELK